jgi:hypothetical protein
MLPLHRRRGSESQKNSPFFHRMELDVGADDVDDDIYQALHGVHSD